jgi:hypothetical protein
LRHPDSPAGRTFDWGSLLPHNAYNQREEITRQIGELELSLAQEHSVFVPAERDREKWEEQYGNLHPAEQAVVFIGGDPQSPRIVAVPSGGGKRDLASLVSDIVSIQAMELPAQVDGASLSVDSVWLLCSIAFRPTPL